MLTVVTSLNDKFDGTDKKFSEHITGLNEAADAMYSSTTQSLQVGDVGTGGMGVAFIARPTAATSNGSLKATFSIIRAHASLRHLGLGRYL